MDNTPEAFLKRTATHSTAKRAHTKDKPGDSHCTTRLNA